MGKPPADDDRSDPGRAAREDDPDRAAILARRQRFIALALTGLTSAACDKPNDDPNTPKGKAAQESKGDDGARPQPCLDVAPTPGDSEGADAKPMPCLEVAPPPEPDDGEDPFASPNACLKVAMPPDEPAKPKPCLRVKPPEPDEPAKPQPCLKVAPPEPDEPAKPQPCLKVAKPR